MIKLVALFKRPEDVEGFDAHYNDTHAPLMRQVPGLMRMDVTRNLIITDNDGLDHHWLRASYFVIRNTSTGRSATSVRRGAW
jgi:uncharacterized protein (TIGR02118 family)